MPPMHTGLVSMDAGQLQVLRRLDEIFREAAITCRAREIGFPPISSVSALDRIDYFRNFPHLGLAVAPLRPETVTQLARHETAAGDSFDPSQLTRPRYFLPSAACYPVYEHLRDRELSGAECITTVQRCFRNEERYEGLERLLAFTMREVVVIGSSTQTREFLDRRKEWVRHFAECVGLELVVQIATDPFFEAGGQRAQMQKLFPVKEEFVFQGRVAVSSVNFHRNFFGQRWNIRAEDGESAFSGCVAFGLERWLHALTMRYADDTAAILDALSEGRMKALGP